MAAIVRPFIGTPPSHPEIDKDGKISPNGSIVGPFYQGNNISLTCGTSDGKPTPEVSWFKGSEELDSETHVHIEKNGASTVKSRVNVTLKREDLGAKIECHVDNDAIDDPLVSWVEIDLHVPPLSLEVEGPTSPVIAGELVSLTCTIQGAKPAANATWYNKSDVINVMPQTHIDQAPDGTLTTISTVQVPVSRYDHLGTFYCKGSNYVLQGKEAPLLKSLDIQVLYPPAVVMQPVNGVIVNESDSAIIYCTYEANPFNVTDVLWFHEGELLAVPTQDKYEMSMQGYPALTIRNVQKEDRGFYSCLLANDIGRGNATNYAEINVLFPPVVEATISPEDAKEGDSISLFCDILEGNPQNLKRVRWYRYEDFLHETTEREIVWVGASRNTSGVYSCEGQNTAGWGERSEPKELIVRYLPGPADLIELDPPAIKGETATLHCDVEEPGLPPVSIYRWEKDGELLATTSSENYTTDVLGVGSKGNYTCAALNNVGIGPKSTNYLPVYAPPTFIHELPEIRGAARDSPFISFECRVECEPLCEIFWMKDGLKVTNSELYIIRNRVLPEDHLNNYFRSISSSLQFNMTAWPGRRLERDRDRANYTCFSTPNDVGDGVSSSMLFLVEYPPELMSLSENVVRVREGNVPPDVECSASSWPPSTYLWLRDTKVLARDETLSFNQSVTREHMGTYICVAENSHGKSQIELRLEVLCRYNCMFCDFHFLITYSV
ncbi:hemicentin-1-like [Stegodyphus dumicola]|uniref:hemicentin-1-like n=1 Tax=Stegodyphus dumicola TaxID=202533 RepID=UPI0015AC404E|nr:hemicentin-1-like [Stegodyphus dumicola]